MRIREDTQDIHQLYRFVMIPIPLVLIGKI